MSLHLNFDGNQNNGIIFNGNYNGAMFVGADLKPKLSFDYHSFMYSEVFTGMPNYVIENDGTKRLMTEQETFEIVAVATAWVQPIGQEGNPSPEQLKQQRIAELKQLLSASDFKVLPDYQATKTQAENDAIIAQRQAWRDEIKELEA